ncbi:DNA cytosine methyltransferase [Oceanicaulis sp.]|uniref:DNA cytosine methyltransferase n=1 Tax=Oceanicaulis sp. TaxID=1924941 RepID=UPI003F6EDAFF
MKHTVVDLFSGCGGLSQGFEEAGFEIVSAYDSWLPAVETYRRNFSHHIDLCELGLDTELPAADVIIGGPPCQGFSSAGLRRTGDERNTLISVFSRLVERFRPKAFVFENVEGFLTGQSGHFVFELLEPLISAGYRIHLRKINASNFGVPQHRKRVLVIGGLGWDPTFPKHSHSSLGAPGATLLNGNRLPFSPTLGETFSDLPPAKQKTGSRDDPQLDHTFSSFSAADQERASLLKPGQRMRDLPEELWHESYKRRANRRVSDGTPTERRGGAPSGLRRLRADEPSKAITGGALREFVHPTEDRPLTIRECARLQTFPDTFGFIGTQAEKIQMIGNAVPPRLARLIADSLAIDLANLASTANRGALLSFVPTASTGMSPILKKVTHEVEAKFGFDKFSPQGDLWP